MRAGKEICIPGPVEPTTVSALLPLTGPTGTLAQGSREAQGGGGIVCTLWI